MNITEKFLLFPGSAVVNSVIFILMVLLYSCNCNENSNCVPSSCGDIHDIRAPFRLKTDPEGCGVVDYELSCEENTNKNSSVTVLHREGGKFYVRAINYENYTIRLVDARVDVDDDCFSSPYFPLTRDSFSEDDPPYTTYRIYNRKSVGYLDFFNLVEPIEIIECQDEVDTSMYLVSNPCSINNGSDDHPKIYTYAYIGYSMRVSDLSVGCRVSMVSLLPPQARDSEGKIKVTSFIQIQKEMAFGFELSWINFYCGNCSYPLSCCFDDITNHARCLPGTSYPAFYVFKGLLRLTGYAIHDWYHYIWNLCGGHLNLDIVRKIQGGHFEVAPIKWLVYGIYALGFLGIIVTVRNLCGIPLVVAFLIYKWRRRHISGYDTIEEFLQGQNNLMPIRYAYSDIKKMTANFHEMLGKGGFGSVYKGKLRSGQFAAVKMLEKSKANGQDFINEVATIGRIHHANVVRLIGFCSEGSKHALVYEFMSNGSLDSHIFSPERSVSLSRDKIYEISLGVARGIEYLHRGCDIQILHFDIKPHNILLDEKFTPKVSDFGLAKLYPTRGTIASLTAARGTIGYMAPELFYKNIGRVSYKADVYSFGMLLLEMAGKRKTLKVPAADAPEENLSQIYYPFWVYDKLSDGELEIEDATEEEYEIVRKMIITGLWCIQLQPSNRPPMNKVLEMLEGDLEVLQLPPRPLLCPEASMENDGEQSSVEVSESSSSLINNLS